jgi:4-amino-4-deoxy-L-arabinose transferase-like glycosyltransferase
MAQSSVTESRTNTVSLLAVGGATLALGALLAGRSPMTSDEAFSVAIVDRSLGGFTRVLGTEGVAMAPYHIGLWVWTRFGDSDWWIQMFSVVGGAVAICLLFILTHRWLSRRVAFATCVVALASPFFHRYLVNARTYSWLMAIGLATLIAADNVLRRQRRMDSVWLGVAIGLGLASHMTFLVVVGSLGIALIISGAITRAVLKRLLAAAGVATALFLPTLILLFTRRGELAQNAPATPGRFVAVTSSALGSLPSSPILIVGITILVMTTMLRRARDWPTICLASMAVGPPILLALISLVGDDIYNSRYLAPLLPFAAAAAVAGYRLVWAERRETVVPLVVAASSVLAGTLGPTVGDALQADPEAAAAFLSNNVRAGDSVLFEPSYTRIYLARYWGYHPEFDRMLVGFDDASLNPPTRTLTEVANELRAAPTIWLATLNPDSAMLQSIQEGRTPTSQFFGRLQIIELPSSSG